MATKTIDATLFASSHPDIAKRTSVSGLLISLAMMVAGLLIFVSIFEMYDKSSTISMEVEGMVYLPTGSVTKERSMFFDLKHIGELTEMIERGNPDCEAGIKSESSGNVRMDIMISQDNKFAALQLFQFVPYTYTPVTSVRYFTGSDAAAVSAFLSKCRAV